MNNKQVVTMKAVKAGPSGTAGIGDVIAVDPDEYKALLDGGFAVDGDERRKKPVSEPARQSNLADQEATAAEKEKAAKQPANVKAALGLLVPADDDHWTAGKKPAMDVIKGLLGSTTLTRKELDLMFPDFMRPDWDIPGQSPVTPPEAGDSKNNDESGPSINI